MPSPPISALLIQELFASALTLPEAEREAFLLRECVGKARRAQYHCAEL